MVGKQFMLLDDTTKIYFLQPDDLRKKTNNLISNFNKTLPNLKQQVMIHLQSRNGYATLLMNTFHHIPQK